MDALPGKAFAGNGPLIFIILSNRIFLFNAANVINDEKNDNLPLSSTLGKKQSDFVGDIFYSPLSNLSFDYDYSINNALKDFNFHSLTSELKINNFTYNYHKIIITR